LIPGRIGFLEESVVVVYIKQSPPGWEGVRLVLFTITGTQQVALAQRAALRGGLAVHGSIFEEEQAIHYLSLPSVAT
jgi:hypothetical protein